MPRRGAVPGAQAGHGLVSVSNDALPSVGRGAFRYRPDPDWGRLPAGWSYVEVAGVATDSADNVLSVGHDA